jgi:hypothetical protein
MTKQVKTLEKQIEDLTKAVSLLTELALKKELAAVPKGTGFSCWYYQQGLKRLSKDSQKLAVVYSDGRIEPMVQLGNLIESV